MLRIALPNKGRLAEEALELLELAGLAPEARHTRSLQTTLGPGAFDAIFVRANDIPEFVADGAAHFGITGGDLVAESGRALETVLDLGFGKCRLAIAVRDDSSIHAAREIEPGTRVATTFPNVTRRFFENAGVAADIVPISGAAEIAPYLGVADIIVDLVSTGSTLRMNGLREIETVLESSAVLITRPGVDADPDAARALRELRTALQSVLRARDQRYLMANIPRSALPRLRDILPGINGPTIVDILNGGDHVAAHAVVPSSSVYRVIAQLEDLGASGILVTRIERLVP
ncbi:MAG: ATP phosphoribosyltransferase [Longimicrobiales bacterium]